MRKGSPSTYILLAILELAGCIYTAPHHATQTYSDFFAVLGIQGVHLPNPNSRKPTRHLSSCCNSSLFTSKILSGSQSSHPISCNILFLEVSKVDALVLFHTETGTNQWYFLTTHTLCMTGQLHPEEPIKAPTIARLLSRRNPFAHKAQPE